MQELGISQEWILGIVLKLIITFICRFDSLCVMVLKVINKVNHLKDGGM